MMTTTYYDQIMDSIRLLVAHKYGRKTRALQRSHEVEDATLGSVKE